MGASPGSWVAHLVLGCYLALTGGQGLSHPVLLLVLGLGFSLRQAGDVFLALI